MRLFYQKSIYPSIRRGGGGGGGSLGPSQSRGVRERRACRFGTGCAQSLVWGIGVRLVCIYSFIQLRSCQQSTLLPLERSVGLRRRQAAAEHPLANTPWAAERGAAAAGLREESAG